MSEQHQPEKQTQPESNPTDEEQTIPVESQPAPSPRIYVASLSDYNAGRLHGRWIDAVQDPEGLESDIKRMLDDSPEPIAEEWAIHDYEDFGDFNLHEYESLDKVSLVACGVAEHGPAFAAWAALSSEEDHLANFEEAYRGQWPSVEAYAEQLLDDLRATEALAQIPEWLQPHVSLDIAGFGQDLELGGDIQVEPAADGGVYVFEGNL